MIAETELTNKLISSLLECGWMDTKFVIEMIDTYENHKFKINGVEKYLNNEGTLIDDVFEDMEQMYGENHKMSVNEFIYSAYRIVVMRILHHYSDCIECEDSDELFEFSVNYMASNLSLLPDIPEFPWHKDLEITDGEKTEIYNEIDDIVMEF